VVGSYEHDTEPFHFIR